MRKLSLNVDGATHTVDAEADEPLLYVLRDELKMRNPRFGCGLGQCGACTVLIDGRPTRSCITPASSVEGKIRTLSGLGSPERPHPVQAAYIEEEVLLCGYCSNGWIMTAVALLERNANPSDTEIAEAFSDLKCRCGTHAAVMRAVKRAAGRA